MRRIRLRAAAAVCAMALCLTGTALPAAADGASGAVSSAQQAASGAWQGDVFTFTDDMGREVSVSGISRVAACTGSFAEVWSLAGGELCAVTDDAYDQHGLELDDSVANVGGIKSPSAELLIAAEPDFIIMSANTAGHVELDSTLTQAGIAHAYFSVETFSDYMRMLRTLTLMTGRDDLYEQNGLAVEREIDKLVADAQEQPARRVLLIRAYSSGAKAKGADNMAGAMLHDLGCVNIADENPSLLEDMSLEKILEEDPEFIFVTTMGASGDDALAALEQAYTSNPAWASLSAVKSGSFVVLPKELFHLKPNERWAESYKMLYDILFGDSAA